jgi:hypothetical protein
MERIALIGVRIVSLILVTEGKRGRQTMVIPKA